MNVFLYHLKEHKNLQLDLDHLKEQKNLKLEHVHFPTVLTEYYLAHTD